MADKTRSRAFYELAHNVRQRDELTTMLAEAQAAGGRILKLAQTVFWDGHSGCFADSDGHPWEVAWNPCLSFAEGRRLVLP